jgi:pilus assembly protein CpaF
MFLITLAEKGGDSQQLEFAQDEVTIGRLAGNDIVLAKGNVSKNHCRLVAKDGKFLLVDLGSTNGTFVNGKRVAGQLVVKPSDAIFVGDYVLHVEAPGARVEGAATPALVRAPLHPAAPLPAEPAAAPVLA